MRPYDGPFDLPPGVTWSVHGHTPVREPCRLGAQVYTDLGAVVTGRLCLAALDPAGPSELTVIEGEGSARRARALPMFGVSLPSAHVRA